MKGFKSSETAMLECISHEKPVDPEDMPLFSTFQNRFMRGAGAL
jgi:hypothetical protein